MRFLFYGKINQNTNIFFKKFINRFCIETINIIAQSKMLNYNNSYPKLEKSKKYTMKIEKVDNFYRILSYADTVDLDNLSPVEFATLYLVKYKYHENKTEDTIQLPHDELSLELMLEYINLTEADSSVDREFVKKNQDLIDLLSKNKEDSLTLALSMGIEIFDLMNLFWQLKKMGLFSIEYNFNTENLTVTPTTKLKTLS